MNLQSGNALEGVDMVISIPLCTKTNQLQLKSSVTLGIYCKKAAISLKRLKYWGAVQYKALITRKIRHPNIVTFFGVFNEPYLGLVLELMHSDMYQCLYGERKLSLLEKIEFARDIASGLYYLHNTMGIVHRDIKPQNILASWTKRNLLTWCR